MTRCAAVALAVLVALAPNRAGAGAASNGADDVPTVEAVREALRAHRVTEAYRLAERRLAAQPTDAIAAIQAAESCIDMALLDKAKDHLRIALEADPDQATLHGLLARIAVYQGNDELARREATIAVEQYSREQIGRDILTELDLIDRFRTPSHASAPPAGSPRELIHRALQRVALHVPSPALLPLLDRGMMLRKGRSAATDPGAAILALDDLRARLSAYNTALVAWDISPDSGDGVFPVRLVLDTHWTMTSIAFLQRQGDPTAILGLVDPRMQNRVRGIDASERGVVLGRMIGTQQRMMALAMVHVVNDHGELKIGDVTLHGLSLRTLLAERAVLGRGGASAVRAELRARSVEVLSGILGWGLGIELFVGAVVGLVVVMRRFDRNRRPRRRAAQ